MSDRIDPLLDSPEGAEGVVGEPGSNWPTSGKRNVPPTPPPPGIEPLLSRPDIGVWCDQCHAAQEALDD